MTLLLLCSRFLWWNLRSSFFALNIRKWWSEVFTSSLVPCDTECHVLMFVLFMFFWFLSPPCVVIGLLLHCVLLFRVFFWLIYLCLIVKFHHNITVLYCAYVLFLCVRYFLIPYILGLDPCYLDRTKVTQTNVYSMFNKLLCIVFSIIC